MTKRFELKKRRKEKKKRKKERPLLPVPGTVRRSGRASDHPTCSDPSSYRKCGDIRPTFNQSQPVIRMLALKIMWSEKCDHTQPTDFSDYFAFGFFQGLPVICKANAVRNWESMTTVPAAHRLYSYNFALGFSRDCRLKKNRSKKISEKKHKIWVVMYLIMLLVFVGIFMHSMLLFN